MPRKDNSYPAGTIIKILDGNEERFRHCAGEHGVRIVLDIPKQKMKRVAKTEKNVLQSE